MKASILRPKEEPDCGADHDHAEQGEESEEAAVVDVGRVDGETTGLVIRVFIRRFGCRTADQGEHG